MSKEQIGFKLPLIPEDKANHFIYGLVIFALCTIPLNWVVGIIMSIIFGVGKEVYDHRNPNNNADIFDAVYTVAGGVVGLLLALFG